MPTLLRACPPGRLTVAPVPTDFHLADEELTDGVQVIKVGGEIDLFTAPKLKQKLDRVIDGGGARVLIDLSDTSFVDSTALGVLIGAARRLRSRQGTMVIVNTDQSIAKTFEITGLDSIFTIRATREQALLAFSETTDQVA